MTPVPVFKRGIECLLVCVAVLLLSSSWSASSAQVLGEGEKVPGLINDDAMISIVAKERPLSDVLDHIINEVGVNILLEQGKDAMISLTLNNVPWRDALDIVAEKAGCIVIEKSSKVFRVEKPERVQFTFVDEDIKRVITAIALAGNADVIIAPDVEGTVNMNVDDIPWKDAMENVVKTLGYHMVEENRGVYRIVTSESLVQQLETRVFELKYIRPRNIYVPKIASEYIEGENQPAQHESRVDFPLLKAIESLLSDNGKLDFFPKDNVIFVKDIKPILDRIDEILERLDQEPLQVLIDVQFISFEKRDNFDASFGFTDPLNGTGIGASWDGAKRALAFPFNLGKGGFNDTVMPGPTPNIDINNWTPVPGVTNGTLDFSPIKFLVHLVEISSSSRVFQNPHVVTLDHHEATINVGDTVRWAQIEAKAGQAGDLQYTIKEASNSPIHLGFQLFVTPHVIPGTNRIVMSIIPKAESLSGKSTDANMEGFDKFSIYAAGFLNEMYLPRVRSQTVVTNLMLESGQFGVIGGLVSNRETEVVTKVPWLGDIPYLGYLFKSKSSIKIKEDLIVMIRPRIIEGGASKAKMDLSEEFLRIYESGGEEFSDLVGDMGVGEVVIEEEN